MKMWLASVLFVIASPILIAQDSNELVLTQGPFAVHSAFWPNLHHVLWAEAWARRPPSDENAAGVLPDPLRADLRADERRAWDAAVAYYDAEIADLHLLFEMRSIRKAMIAAGTEPPASGLDPAHRKVLIAAAPIYKKYWWRAHDAANRSWIADTMSKVASLTPAVPDRLARLYGTPWFTGGIRVDVVRVASREGAMTSIDPPPAHITMSSSAPALQGWGSAEVLFHEASHVLAFPLMADFAAELRTQRKASPHLWHVALFYLTGEVVRQELQTRGIEYEPYMHRTGLLDRMGEPGLKAPVETYWKPYVNGAVAQDEAIRNVVSAVEGADMSMDTYLTDLLLRVRMTEVAAVLVLALSAAFFLGPVVNRRALIVIVLVTAILALTVRTVTIPAGNIAVHLLAVALSFLAARTALHSVAARPRTIRATVTLVAAVVGYLAGRELSLVSFWALVSVAG